LREEQLLNTYEGMFLLNSVEAKRDWDGTAAHVQDILKKHGAEVATNYRWDERKLAYEVNRQKRGTYYLVYFRCPTEALVAIRRDCELSEIVMRQLILRWSGEAPPMPTEDELAKHQAELAALAQPAYGRGGRRRP